MGGRADGRAGRDRRARIEQLLAPGSLAGRRVLVTAGGTREPLDAARFLGNRSSGRMGVALAEEARRRGAEVVLLAANLAVPAPAGVETIATPTAEAMLEAALALRGLRHRPARGGRRRLPARRRRSRASARRASEPWTVELEPTADIARAPRRAQAAGAAPRRLRRRPRRGRPRAQAAACSPTKNADLVVFNDVSRADIAFDAADNEVVLLSGLRERPVAKAPKAAIAAAILDEVELLLERATSPAPA